MKVELAGADRGLSLAVYCSSLGNYFFREIAELIAAGFQDLGLPVRIADETAGFRKECTCHIVVAPHEFFQLGAGPAVDSKTWPENVILFNTEQPSTEWFSLAAQRFPKARCIWDIDFESSLRIARQGFDCSYLPLGFASGSPLFETIRQLPLHEGTREIAPHVRTWSDPNAPLAMRPLDLVFLGHSSPRREQFFARHTQSLRSLAAYYHKSNVSRPLIPGQTTSMNTATSIGLAQRSKILLNLHHGTDKYFEWHRIVLLGMAQRALVVSEPCSLAPPFRANHDFVEAPLDELPDRIRYHLTTRQGQVEAQEMVDRAYETLTQRCQLRDILGSLLGQLRAGVSTWRPVVSLDIVGRGRENLPEANERANGASIYSPSPRPSSPKVPGDDAASAPLAICVVTPEVNGVGDGTEAGAAQVELAQELAAAGYTVTLLHTQESYGANRSPGYWNCYFHQLGIEYICLPSLAAVPIDAPEAQMRSYLAWEWLRTRKFDVVHFPDLSGIGFYSVTGKRQGLGLEGTRLCIHAHGTEAWRRQAAGEFVRNVGDLEIDYLERESLGKADALFVPTCSMMGWLEKQNWPLPTERFVGPRDHSAPVPSSVDSSKAPGIKVREFVFVGTLDAAGGFDFFCDALDKVAADLLSGVQVTCLGREGAVRGRRCGPYLTERARVWACQTRIIKSADHDALTAALARPGVLAVIPSAVSNSPAAVRHCLARGIPFLIRDTSGATELIALDERDQAGFKGTVSGLAAALTKALEGEPVPARSALRPDEREQQLQAWHEKSKPQAEDKNSASPASAESAPLVSVCLVHFNRRQYLKQALESLLAQDYPNFEVVLVDDGSTDPAALAYLDELEPMFRSRGWTLVRQSNRYLGAARNAAAARARGEYLLFMDDDNYAKPEELSTFMRVARQTGADLLTAAMDLFTGAERPTPKNLKARWLFLGPAVTVGAYRNQFGDANALVRRDVFTQLGGFTEDYGITHEDWEFHARAVLAGYRMETIPQALFWYRYTPGSMIHHTPRYANHQRSLRPYVDAVPAALQELVRFSQGTKFQLDDLSGQVGNYDFAGRLLKALLSAGRLLAENGQAEAADNLFMEALRSCDQIANHGLQFEALLLTAKTLAEIGRKELALKLAERAVKQATRIRHEASLRAARTVVDAIKKGGDIETACSGMPFLEVGGATSFVRRQTAEPVSPAAPDPAEKGTLAARATIKIGVLSAEDPQLACPHIRLHSILTCLQKRGSVEVLSVGKFQQGKLELAARELARADIIIVQRQMAALLSLHELRRVAGQARIVFEIDDALTMLPPWHRAAGAYEKIRPRLEEYLRGADLVTVSTPALAKLYATFNSRIEVLPVVLDDHLWGQSPAPLAADGKPLRILFSGTLDHLRDLTLIEEPLLQLLAEYPKDVEFVYWGNITERLRSHPQVKAGPEFKTDYRQYAALLQGMNVALAVVPLEDIPFNAAKSAIKWLEYGSCGIPAIFSDVEAYAHDVQNGENGLIVPNNSQAWLQALRQLINDAEGRARLGQAARRAVLASHTVERQADRWLDAYERALETAPLENPIEVSIIIPVFNRLDFTRKCLEALARNTSPGICEIIVVDNGSTDGTGEFLAAAQKAGSLRVLAQPENLGFAKACNLGARAAKGRHYLFLNNDTEVTAGWLEPLRQILDNDPSAAAVGSKLLFPDGTIQHAGVALGELPEKDPLLAVHVHYRQPGDLPAANRRMVYQALTAACLLVRRECFAAVQGFDEGFWNGYEDVDLCLQFQQHGWRCVYEPASVVIHYESQSGPARFQRVQDNVRRLHRKWLGQVSVDVLWAEGTPANPLPTSRISAYTAPALAANRVSIIILTHNQLPHTQKCLASLAAHTSSAHEIIVVDNGSTDGSVEFLREYAASHSRVRVIFNPTNRGFAAGNNQGMAVARGTHVLLLNNDTIVTSQWLERMLAVFEAQPRTGLVGPMSNYVSGPQLVSKVNYQELSQLDGFAQHWSSRHDGQSTPVPRLVGFCLLARRELVDRIGGLDEAFGSGNFEDDDYCLRAAMAGFEARIARDVFIHHTGSQTFKGAGIDYAASMRRNWELFKAKWGLPTETAVEQGYRTPLRLADPRALKVSLTELGSSSTEPTPASAVRRAIVLPATARVGDLKPARDLLEAKELVSAWTATIAALEARPFHPEAWLLLAEIAWTGRDQAMAKRCVARAEKLTPRWRAVRKFLKKHPALSGGMRVAFPALNDTVTEPRLTVCIIARNEEEFLPRCLQSVRALASQIIVVDTGSTDRTVDIAREYEAEVYSFAWNDDFSAARNAALEHARGDWILSIDADEELLPESGSILRSEMQLPAVLAYRMRLVDQGKEADGCHYVPRLFRNAPGLFYVGRIHEQVFSSIEVRRREWELENRLSAGTFLHHGYASEVVRSRDKIGRNLRLLERAVEENPQEPNLLMNLGLELIRSGRKPEGMKHYWSALRALSQLPESDVVPELRETLLTQLASHLLAARDFRGIKELLNSSVSKTGNLTASLHFAHGLALMEERQYARGIEEFRACIQKRDLPTLTPVHRDCRGAAPRHCWALCLRGLNQVEEAARVFDEALQEEPQSRPLRHDYARFLADAGQPVPALNLLHQLVAEKPDDLEAWRKGGEIALSDADFLEFALDWTSEALKALPRDSVLLGQRAEALLLNEDLDAARACLESWGDECSAKFQAARILCELAQDHEIASIPHEAEAAVSRGFMQWYRQLLKWERSRTVLAINERMNPLRAVLPTAADMLGAVLVAVG